MGCRVGGRPEQTLWIDVNGDVTERGQRLTKSTKAVVSCLYERREREGFATRILGRGPVDSTGK